MSFKWSIPALMVARSPGPRCSDSDVNAFLTATGITDNTIIDALCTLITSAKANGWWDKCYAIYPIVGGDATKHSYNLKNTSLYQISFSAGWTHASTGATPNGSAYADTGLAPSSVIAGTFSTHLSVYTRNNTNGGNDIGCSNAGLFLYSSVRSSDFALYNTNDANFGVVTANTSSIGYFMGSRTANNSNNVYKNGSSIGSNTGTETGNLPSIAVYFGAINSSGAASDHTTREYAFATIGDSISGALAATMYTDIQTFQTSLSRQI